MFLDIVKGKHIQIALPIAVLAMLAMIILPLPPVLLDIFFTLNIVISLLILVKSVNVERPLDFTTFPSIILIATLIRLAMNVASTRVILLEGHTSPEAAGTVIKAFGEYVIGGQYAVGLIVFTILVVINFIVITKGTGRVSEVSARFKLDSMPGKQMAIDADLNTGAIDVEEAAKRREEVQLESDFYGAMDGATKFVKGDAIAGLVILFINIIGGLILGVASYQLSFSQAAETYILLSIGDGLVAQIPSLILSVATGIIITRAGKRASLGDQVTHEFSYSSALFYVPASIMFVIGVIPGMPTIAFVGFSLITAFIGYRIDLNKKVTLASSDSEEVSVAPVLHKDIGWSDIPNLKPIEVLIGFGLVDWVQKDDGELINRLKGLRKKLSQELGFLIPTISLHDDSVLHPYTYKIKINGEDVSFFEVHPGKILAVGESSKRLRGVKIKEPAFDMPAVWVDKSERGMVESQGITISEAEMVLVTHLSVVIKSNIYNFFGFDELKKLLDNISSNSSALIDEFNKKNIGMDNLLKVCRLMLKDNISLVHIKTTIQQMVENYSPDIDHLILYQYVRNALGRSILKSVFRENSVEFVTVHQALQSSIANSAKQNGIRNAAIEPGLLERIAKRLSVLAGERKARGLKTVLVVDDLIRYSFQRSLSGSVDGLVVVGVGELPDDLDFSILETLSP